MSEAVLILPNMRGGCATIGGTVHTLFRVNGRRHSPMARPEGASGHPPAEAVARVERSHGMACGAEPPRQAHV